MSCCYVVFIQELVFLWRKLSKIKQSNLLNDFTISYYVVGTNLSENELGFLPTNFLSVNLDLCR